MDLGEYIAKLRAEKGWGQRELARRTNGAATYMAINHIENGDTKNPGIGTLLALAKALDVHYTKLVMAYQGVDPAKAGDRTDEDLEELMQKALEIVRKEKNE